MKTIIRAVVSLAISAVATGYVCGQTSMKRAPDCLVPFTFTANGSQGVLANYGPGGVQGPALCTFWTLGYASVGFSGISLVVQSAPAASASTPGAFVTFAGSVLTGINPNTSITGAQTTLSNGIVAIPWVRVTLASSTGTGTVFGLLQGWNTGNSGSGGGGVTPGTVTTVNTGCFLTGGPITTTGTISSDYNVEATPAGTSYTVKTGDCGMVVPLLNVLGWAVTLPTAGSAGFPNGWWSTLYCQSTQPNGCTITPTTGTINGQANISIGLTSAVVVVSDGAGNWYALLTKATNPSAPQISSRGLAAAEPPCGSFNFGFMYFTTDNLTVDQCNGVSYLDFALGGTANQKVRSVGAGFNGGGSALVIGQTVYFFVPFACTITGYNITADTGTISFDVWKIASGTAIPTVTNTILTGGFLALATGTALHSTSVTLFTTTTVTAFDIIAFEIQAVSSATNVSVVLACNAG